METLTLVVNRVCDPLESRSGSTGWLAVRWYPVLLLFYAGGVAAVATNRYKALLELMHARAFIDGRDEPLVAAVTRGLNDVTKYLRLLPGLEQK